MIRGYFSPIGVTTRPFIRTVLQFPSHGLREIAVDFLVDTGADRTILGPADAHRLGLAIDSLPEGRPSIGVGGRTRTRTIDAVLTMDGYATTLALPVLAVPPGRPGVAIPSLLGRDILRQFALFVEQRTGRVLLLTAAEAAALPLP